MRPKFASIGVNTENEEKEEESDDELQSTGLKKQLNNQFMNIQRLRDR
jgi:hypothetical protein